MDAYDIRGLRKISVHHYKGEEGKSQFILKISDGDHFSARSASCTSKKDANLNDFSYKTWEKRVLLGKIAGKMKGKYKIYNRYASYSLDVPERHGSRSEL